MPNVTANAIVADQVTVPKLDIEKELVAEDIVINGLSIEGDIADSQTALTEHIEDINTNTAPHLTPAEHKQMNGVLSRFSFSEGDMVPVTAIPPTLPAGSINWNTIQEFFARNCEPDTPSAPGKVYVSRVPYAVQTGDTEATIKYKWSKLARRSNVAEDRNDTYAYSSTDIILSPYEGLEAKLMDNVLPDGNPRQHAGSTDTTVGVDDYVGKEWAFWWGHCNYTYDEFGQKHITAFEDVAYPGHTFSETRQTGAFGPKFWFFCKPEKSQYTDGNGNLRWTTDTGEQDGQPFTQLWGISDTRWSELPEVKRNKLIELGITVNDFHIWPECLVWDKAQQTWLERPYWIHSAYCGGWGYDDITGEPTLVSKKNAVLRRNLTYQDFNAIYGAASNGKYPGIGRGGSACVQGFGLLFHIVKNATKYTQPDNVYKGMCNNTNVKFAAYADTAEAGYIFPVGPAGTSVSGIYKNTTVYLTANSYTDSKIDSVDRSISQQIGRVIDIKDVTFLSKTSSINGDPGEIVEMTAKCLILDPDTVQPFLVRTDAAQSSQLQESGIYAASNVLSAWALSGITDNILGKHDGQCYSNNSTRFSHRIQGTEFGVGASTIASDVIYIREPGVSVEFNGETIQTSDNFWVVLISDPLKPRLAGTDNPTLQVFLNAGYKVIAFVKNFSNSSTGVISAFLYNADLTQHGILHPTLTGSNGAYGFSDVTLQTYVTAKSAYIYWGHMGSGARAGVSEYGLQPFGGVSHINSARD